MEHKPDEPKAPPSAGQAEPAVHIGYAYRAGACMHVYLLRRTRRVLATRRIVESLSRYRVAAIQAANPDRFWFGMYLDPEDLYKEEPDDTPLVESCRDLDCFVARSRSRGWVVDLRRSLEDPPSDRPVQRTDHRRLEPSGIPTRWGREFHGVPVCTHPFYSANPGGAALDSILSEARRQGITGEGLRALVMERMPHPSRVAHALTLFERAISAVESNVPAHGGASRTAAEGNPAQ